MADGEGATAQWRKMQEPRPARWTQLAVAAAAAGPGDPGSPSSSGPGTLGTLGDPKALASQERKMP